MGIYDNFAQQLANISAQSPLSRNLARAQQGISSAVRPFAQKAVYDIATKQYGKTPERLDLIDQADPDGTRGWKPIKDRYVYAINEIEDINNFVPRTKEEELNKIQILKSLKQKKNEALKELRTKVPSADYLMQSRMVRKEGGLDDLDEKKKKLEIKNLESQIKTRESGARIKVQESLISDAEKWLGQMDVKLPETSALKQFLLEANRNVIRNFKDILKAEQSAKAADYTTNFRTVTSDLTKKKGIDNFISKVLEDKFKEFEQKSHTIDKEKNRAVRDMMRENLLLDYSQFDDKNTIRDFISNELAYEYLNRMNVNWTDFENKGYAINALLPTFQKIVESSLQDQHGEDWDTYVAGLGRDEYKDVLRNLNKKGINTKTFKLFDPKGESAKRNLQNRLQTQYSKILLSGDQDAINYFNNLWVKAFGSRRTQEQSDELKSILAEPAPGRAPRISVQPTSSPVPTISPY